MPALCGTALKNKGIQTLLDAVIDYLPSPVDVRAIHGVDPKTLETVERTAEADQPFTALAFKVTSDPFVGRLVYLRIYAGSAKTGAIVLNSTRDERDRLGRLVRMHANHREEVDEIFPGEIVAAVGLKRTLTGDTLCDPRHACPPGRAAAARRPEPGRSQASEPARRAQQAKMDEALRKRGDEDPTCQGRQDEETGQTIVSGMGELHLEVLVERMRREYTVEARVGKPQVAYREAITSRAEAEGRFVRQTGGHGQYGHVWGEAEPLERGKGFEFVHKIVGGTIPREFIRPVDMGAREALEPGCLIPWARSERRSPSRFDLLCP